MELMIGRFWTKMRTIPAGVTRVSDPHAVPLIIWVRLTWELFTSLTNTRYSVQAAKGPLKPCGEESGGFVVSVKHVGPGARSSVDPQMSTCISRTSSQVLLRLVTCSFVLLCTSSSSSAVGNVIKPTETVVSVG